MKERAMNGNADEMDLIENDWSKGTIVSSNEEKSFIRNAFNSNLPKRVREGDVNGRWKLESLWNDGSIAATDEEKLSIRTDSNAAIQQKFKEYIKTNAMSGEWLDMELSKNLRAEGFISVTDDEMADITKAYDLARAKK